MTESPAAVAGPGESPWQRLSVRVIWVDLVQSVLSLLPGVFAVVFLDVELSASMWPLILLAVIGVVGAVGDMLRWAFTRYRINDVEIEVRSGVLVRRRRTVSRDRLRSVDTHAKLRHRLAGLRVVTIGAGQQVGAGEAALVLDAPSKQDAARLRRQLLDAAPQADDPDAETETETETESGGQVFATFRPGWVIYNMFSIWAFLMAAGLLWGLFWLVSAFGIDLIGPVSRSRAWDSLGWPATVLVVLAVAGVVGAVGMGVNFLTANWGFELARVRSGERSYLRTRRGLFSTREVSRDEARVRGLSIDEPVLWRWMGMADTSVITTGLSVWDMEQPTAILPRGPVRVARAAAARVLGEPSPLEAPLRRHPPAALRRRLWWATLAGAAPVAALLAPAAAGVVPWWIVWAALGLLPVTLLAGVVAYRALGHAIVGDYLVVRSGLMSRSSSALRRDAVSTVAVRQSLLQKRLGLSTVSAMTAAGWGAYEAPDVAAAEALEFAHRAAPHLLDEFVTLEGGS